MKLGVFTVLLSDIGLKDSLDYFKRLGIEAVELSTRSKAANPHLRTDALLADKREIEHLTHLLNTYQMEISALSCHSNPVHPQKEIAAAAHADFEKCVLLAEKLSVERINTFSGCPGGSPGSLYPNWVTCAWPDEFLKVLEYQWNDVLLPYWAKAAQFAKNHGVKICLEMHPGFCVYNPETLLKLRNSIGSTIGANFDPSHLFWQGIDPATAIQELKGAIYHFHAKDVKVNQPHTNINGVLDTKHYCRELDRSWIFRTVGYGHDEQTWKNIFSSLRLAGYDDVISIEHEDSLMSVREGLEKAVELLKRVIIHDKPGGMWWA